MTNWNLDTMPGHSARVVSFATLLLTSTIPVIFLIRLLTGCESEPALCLGLLLNFRVLASPVAVRHDNVVPFVSVSKLKKEQRRQQSQQQTQEYRICIPLERFLSGDCCSLERTQLKGMAEPRGT
jgi:hypothetical protein